MDTFGANCSHVNLNGMICWNTPATLDGIPITLPATKYWYATVADNTKDPRRDKVPNAPHNEGKYFLPTNAMRIKQKTGSNGISAINVGLSIV